MSIVSKMIAGASLISVALLFLYAGPAGTPAFAQYDVPPGQYGQYGQYDQYDQYGQYDVPPGDQYGLPPEDQYGLPPEDQYDPPPTTTAPLPESQYRAPAEDRNVGGGDTGNGATAPVDEGNDKGGDTDGNTGGGNTGGGNGNDAGGDTGATTPVGEGPNEDDDDATESAATPERQASGAGGRGIGSLGGVLVWGVVLLAVLSLIAVLAFLIERREDRRG